MMLIHSRMLRLRCYRSEVYPERPSTSTLRTYAQDDRKRRVQHERCRAVRPERTLSPELVEGSKGKSKGHPMDNAH